MRWDRLVEELSAQFDSLGEAEARAEIEEMARAEAAATALADRWRAVVGRRVEVRLRGGSALAGTLAEASSGWLMLAEGERRTLVPGTAVVALWPLAGVAPPPSMRARLGLGPMLRAIAADGAQVLLHTDGGTWQGRLVRVGADHLDVRTPAAVVTIAWAGLLAVENV